MASASKANTQPLDHLKGEVGLKGRQTIVVSKAHHVYRPFRAGSSMLTIQWLRAARLPLATFSARLRRSVALDLPDARAVRRQLSFRATRRSVALDLLGARVARR